MNKIKDFHLKQFSIIGGHSGMAVSTDAILLGAWANLLSANTILDIGTGTGLLALMSAQRNQTSIIQAIDIDSDAINSAKINVKNSPWADRITIEKNDVTQQKNDKLYDHIICNPPYFNSGEVSQWQARANARHTLTLGHNQLLTACQSLLSAQGEASFILPKEEGRTFIERAKSLGWFVSRLCEINTTVNKQSYRMLIALTRYPVNTEHTQLTIHQDGHYSQAFIELTQDFYLKM